MFRLRIAAARCNAVSWLSRLVKKGWCRRPHGPHGQNKWDGGPFLTFVTGWTPFHAGFHAGLLLFRAGGFQRLACPPAGYIKHHQTNYWGWHQDGCITALRSKVLWLRLHWLLFVWRSQAAAKQVQGKDLTWIKTDLPLMPWMPERNKGLAYQ